MIVEYFSEQDQAWVDVTHNSGLRLASARTLMEVWRIDKVTIMFEGETHRFRRQRRTVEQELHQR